MKYGVRFIGALMILSIQDFENRKIRGSGRDRLFISIWSFRLTWRLCPPGMAA